MQAVSFSTKIFCAIFFTTILACTFSVESLYFLLKDKTEQEYFSKYQSLGEIIANTFKQMEGAANIINENAARILFEIEKNSKLPTNKNLEKLANELGIKAFYVTNDKGKFIRSTDLPLKLQKNSLFTYCKDYQLLIKGNASLYRTPIIPGYPYNIPMKLTMIPNHNKTLVIESGMELEYIGNILNEVIKKNKDIQSIGFYTPSGFELGYIAQPGEYHRGRKYNSLDLNESSHHNKLLMEKNIVFNVKIFSVDPYCCECIYKKISDSNGKYFYILRFNVSRDPLIKKIDYLRIKVLFLITFASIVGLFISKILANKLVLRIKNINNTAADIIKSNNLDIRVGIKNKSDEITELAETFNKMIQNLKISQSSLIESEKKAALLDLAASLAHDLGSPIAIMEIMLNTISNDIPITKLTPFRSAIQSVRNITNNLLMRYRHSNIEFYPQILNLPNYDDGNITRPILLPMIIEYIISQKRQEWSNNPCKIISSITANAKKIWICIIPNEIKRILSNLLNNSYEALDKVREIKIELSYIHQLVLYIKDEGIGIPINMIQNVLRGESLKHSGKGLGLFTAKRYMESIGGELTLSSIQNVGTEIKLTFSSIVKPIWFPHSINIPFNSTIIILDDDTCMLDFWDQRLKSKGFKYLYFVQSKDFLDWYEKNPFENQKAIFLFDYEISDEDYNGLDLLEKINPTSRGYLITSRAEEVAIQNHCERLKVWLIPKILIGNFI